MKPAPNGSVLAWVGSQPISHFDAQIAAIARITGASVATRNVNDFDGCGVGVVNPWKG